MDRDRDYWIEQAEATAQNPGGWLATAEALKRSADLVFAESDQEWLRAYLAWEKSEWPDLAETLADVQAAPFLWPVYLQLAGLALENLAKGIAVARDPSLVAPDSKGRLVRKWGHINAALFSKLGIELDAEEAALVERLGVYVEWAGRYPVPRFAMQLRSARTFHRGSAPVAIHDLYERLHAELVAAMPAHAERGEQERKERGLEAYAVLRGLPTQEIDGATTYVAEAEPEQPAAAVVCIACETTFLLSLRYPGAYCGCGDLHWLKLRYDGSLGRVIPVTETLYRDEIDAAGPSDEPNV